MGENKTGKYSGGIEKIRQIMTIRENAVRLDVYNEGLVVFLYDPVNGQYIRETNPEIIWGCSGETLKDSATRKLTENGSLLIYGLHSDDCLKIDVAVGAKLSEAELLSAERFQMQSGILHLPSGKLRIDSYNTLPMGDNGDAPPDEGAEIAVPPGLYAVTLYRIDRKINENAETANEIIVLTPVSEFIEMPNILFRECLE